MLVAGTYSIAACDLDRGEWGVGVQSKFPAIGAIAPWAEVGAGAVVTQAIFNPGYGPAGLTLLRSEVDANGAVERLVCDDPDRERRQVGIVDARGGSASYTGAECPEWAGERRGECFAAQGNTLVSAATLDALTETFIAMQNAPLAERLLSALEAAQAAGGDRRGEQSAALLVVRKDAGVHGLSDLAVNLRVDDHPQPLTELRRLFRLTPRWW